MNASPNDHVRPCNLKPQQRDLTPVLLRPVEPALRKRKYIQIISSSATGQCVYTSMEPASRCNREQHMDPSRGGLTSKVHAVVDANGMPTQLGLTPGEA